VTTADIVLDRALALAQERTDEETAVLDLLGSCGGNRVAVVIARRNLLAQLESDQQDHAARAAELLEKTLSRLPEE
jgi:hypothetical protein